MLKAKLYLYLNHAWQQFDCYNEVTFDRRRDGQLRSGMAYIVTAQKTRFRPMRKARLEIEDTAANVTETLYYHAYFNSQKRGLNYWWHEVTLVDPARRVQGEMINGLRVIQNSSNSITLYDTFLRLLNTTPLRLTTQSNKYLPTADSEPISRMQAIRSPEYAWSCRTLLWECLEEIGMDMGGYFPQVEFGESGKYVISFVPTDDVVKTVTDIDYISIADTVDKSQVCSEIDTDIANIIATNQGTASVVFPSQVGWITPRTDDVQLTTDNCQIQLPTIPEKVLKVYINQRTISLRDPVPNEGYETLYEVTGDEELDVTDFFPEYKRYSSLNIGVGHDEFTTDLYRYNTCYWTENSKDITIVSESILGGWTALYSAIQSAIYKQYAPAGRNEMGFPSITVNGTQIQFDYNPIQEFQPLQFRVEYIARETSSKVRAAKQERCDYEYVLPYNQRAEIVDAEMLGSELDKTVNQQGVDVMKTVNVYKSLADVLPLGTAYTEGQDSYIITANEYVMTSHDNVQVTHSFSKNWAMLSPFLKQRKAYRNTNIPTDILERNLYYEDFFVISEVDGTRQNLGEKGLLTYEGTAAFADVFTRDAVRNNTEVNNFGLYAKKGVDSWGVVVSCNSFGVGKSIVFSAKMQNNLTAGKTVDPDNEYYVQDALYTDEDGTFDGNNGEARMIFGVLNNAIKPDELPLSDNLSQNQISDPVITATWYVDKSSAEQIGMTYQAHVVSDMADIVIGDLIAYNNPLVQDSSAPFPYRFWGLKKALPKRARLVTSEYGTIEATSRGSIWDVEADENDTVGGIGFRLDVSPGAAYSADQGYIGWAITDEKGRLYLARNSHPNENQTLYFNHLHGYHRED